MMSLEKLIEKLESIEGLLKEQILDKKKVLTFKEVLYVLGVSKNTLYDMIRKNQIPAYRPVKGKVFFFRKELQYWLMAHSNAQVAIVERIRENSEDTPDKE